MTITTSGCHNTEAQRRDNLTAAAFTAWSVETTLNYPDDALEWWADRLDDDTIVRYIRSASVIASMVGAERYHGMWAGPEHVADARAWARLQLDPLGIHR